MPKQGLAYYRAETDRYQHREIKRLKKEFGPTGYAVWDFIVNEIYRVKGCFIIWDESTVFDVADYWNIKETVVKEVVNYCCYIGLFKKGLINNESVLFSPSIVKRYTEMCHAAKRKDVKIPEEFKETPEETIKPPEELPKPQEVDAQSKVKKSIEKKEGGNPHPLKGSNLFRQPTIPTYGEVLQKFKMSGGTEEMAKKFYEVNEGVGWFHKGSPITNFANFVNGYISSWKSYGKNDPAPVNLDYQKQKEQRERERLNQLQG